MMKLMTCALNTGDVGLEFALELAETEVSAEWWLD